MAMHTTTFECQGQLVLVHYGRTKEEKILAEALNKIAKERAINAIMGRSR